MFKVNGLSGYIIVDSDCNPSAEMYESFFDAVNQAACMLSDELCLKVDECEVSMLRNPMSSINSKNIYRTEIKDDVVSEVEFVSSVVVRKKEH